MTLKEMEEIVERKILRLFSTFYENPAIFLREADVQCYLYSLLINDPYFRNICPISKEKNLTVESKTLLVHAETYVGMKGGNKNVDISIFKPLDILPEEVEGAIGIEIKFNRRIPARKEPSNILQDVKKVGQMYHKGYILWLNWNREINDEHLKIVKKRVEEYKNVKLFYLDMFSEPIKTNVSEIRH